MNKKLKDAMGSWLKSVFKVSVSFEVCFSRSFHDLEDHFNESFLLDSFSNLFNLQFLTEQLTVL